MNYDRELFNKLTLFNNTHKTKANKVIQAIKGIKKNLKKSAAAL